VASALALVAAILFALAATLQQKGALISIWFDPADEGNLRRQVSYERAPGQVS
jgi:hypothetical protein